MLFVDGCRLLRKHFSAQDQWYGIYRGFQKTLKSSCWSAWAMWAGQLMAVGCAEMGSLQLGNGMLLIVDGTKMDKTYLKVLSLNEPSDCVENSRLDLSHSSRSTLHWCPWQFVWTQTKPAVTNLVIFDNRQTTHACLLRLIQNLMTKPVDARKM